MSRIEASRLQRILVVDDHAASRRHTFAVLRQLGCSARGACCLDEAVSQAVDWKPTAVLTDWNLGPVNGHDVLAAIRKHWRGPEPAPRFLLMSGSPPDACLLPCGGEGFSAILAKPLCPDLLAGELGLTPAGPTARDEGVPGMADLFRRELAGDLHRLESLVLNGDLDRAADLTHRMIAGSTFAGAGCLETSLRALDSLLRDRPSPRQLADACCEMRREAFDFLDGLQPGQPA